MVYVLIAWHVGNAYINEMPFHPGFSGKFLHGAKYYVFHTYFQNGVLPPHQLPPDQLPTRPTQVIFNYC